MTDLLHTLQMPKFGETWFNRHATTEGIVSEVRGNVVTFVSLVGTRIPVSFERRDNLWEFRRSITPCTQLCARKGCDRPAFLAYERDHRIVSEVVCPYHAPRGVRSVEISAPVPRREIAICPCPECGRDPIEIIGEIPRSFRQENSLFTCQYCGAWWIHSVRNESLQVLLPNLSSKRWTVATLGSHCALDQTHVVLKLRPFKLSGVQPMTLFDHLIDDDF